MNLALVIGAVLLLLLAASIAIASRSARKPGRWRASPTVRQMDSALAIQAQIEKTDIDEMLDAQAAIRRRRGAPSIGDELAEQARQAPG